MKKRIIKYMLPVTAAAAAVMAAAVLCVYRWGGFEENGRGFAAAVCACALVVGIAACFAAAMLAGRIVRPLSDAKTDYTELSHLLNRIEDQRSQIRASGSLLQEKERNLRTIMENISEGLILLDARGVIMATNRSAAELLEAPDGEMTGKHIFAANPHPRLQAAVHTALGGVSSSEMMEQGELALEVTANPVRVDGEIKGVVLFVMDVTEKQAAEQMRREFSANVSHELKTPLTSISGYAEIIREGLVKPEDVQRFNGKIYDEAQRLLSLIEDIIKLSRYDERTGNLPVSETDLYAGAQKVAERLADKAEQYGVTVYVSGGPAAVIGNAQLLDEMIYNLCDNAIKYNHSGGQVEIVTGEENGDVLLTVRDNGIGIPKEHQSRVFERFYRVDKSHSKETGGTGLGLSIVKHGALFHGAAVELESTPGKGTTVRLRFPKKKQK